MSISSVVDQGYRLTAADMGNSDHTLTIVNVSYQGVEDLHVLLHFQGVAKPLLLNPVQCNELARMTNSAVLEEWVGRRVLLRAETDEGQQTIGLYPATEQPVRQLDTVERRSRGKPALRTLIYILFVVALFFLVYLLERFQTVWQWLDAVFP